MRTCVVERASGLTGRDDVLGWHQGVLTINQLEWCEANANFVGRSVGKCDGGQMLIAVGSMIVILI